MRNTIALLAAAVVILGACGSDGTTSTTTGTTDASTTATDAPPATDPPVATTEVPIELSREAQVALRTCLDDAESALFKIQVIGDAAPDPDVLDFAYDDLTAAKESCDEAKVQIEVDQAPDEFIVAVSKFILAQSFATTIVASARVDPANWSADVASSYSAAIDEFTAASDAITG